MSTSANPDLPSRLVDRDARQRGLVPSRRLASTTPVVIGVGAIGRQVAIQLAAMGSKRLTLIDHDFVETANLAPQGYRPVDCGIAKVDATAFACRQLNPAIDVTKLARRFRRSDAATLKTAGETAIFCCVDAIDTRRLIWESLRHRAAFFVDGRMHAEVIRVLASDSPGIDTHYATTLFPAADAHRGSCTARSTIYTANIAAGLMLAQFARWLRGGAVERDATLNLLSGELVAA